MKSVVALVIVLVAACAHQPPGLPNAHQPLPGVTTSGQPDAPTFEALARRGYTTVIDLRAPAENRGLDERRVVEATGMHYVNLPVEGKSGVTYPMARALDEALDNAQGPVLVHCGSGNRVGALIALRARLAGVTADQALALGVAAGLTSLEDSVREQLSESPPDAF